MVFYCLKPSQLANKWELLPAEPVACHQL